MAVSRSILSAGELIREILAGDEEVKSRVTKIFPIAVDKATLPYLVYRRTQLAQNPTKGVRGADTADIEVICYTAGYTEGVELAEAVRNALDGVSATNDAGDLTMRSCYLTDSEEGWLDDAYMQQLVFTVKI